jgi:site-specific DNA recombinase
VPISELKRARDAARADAERAEGHRESGETRLTPELIHRFGIEARKKIRTDGGFSRHYLQTLVQRIDVGSAEIRITGCKIKLLQTLATEEAGLGVERRTSGVRSFDCKWLPGPDSNQRPTG